MVFVLGFVSLKAQVDNLAIAKDLVAKNAKAIGWNATDIDNSIVSDSYFDKTAKVQLVYLQQSYLGLPVYNQILVLAFKNGNLVSKSGGKIGSIEKKIEGARLPSITADIAVETALKNKNISFQRKPLVMGSEKNGHFIRFDNMGIARENITAELMWVPIEDGKKVVLAWQIYFIPTSTSDYWMVRINSNNNTVVDFNNLTVTCNWDLPSKDKKISEHHNEVHAIVSEKTSDLPAFLNWNNLVNKSTRPSSPNLINSATYRVIPFPAESPIHSGGAPATRSNPWTAAPGNATTLNWHNNGTLDFNYTRGNNVWAQEDRNGNNGTGLPANSTSSVDPLSFDFTPSFTVTPTQTTPVQNQQFNITNLFYWNNIIHDIMYQYGFDEVSGNFQASNLGRGGAENDYVLADAQDGSGTNNANFATPADGSSGRMQMYLWSGNPQKDGDVDNGIVSHEFSHGTSNRLTGGPAQAGCLSNAEQMGEGWSDYYGLMFTQNWSTATVNTGFNSPRSVGTYASGQTPTGTGIRSQKYCTNFAVNNKVYAATISTAVHDRGEIWCATLWDMTWNIINQVGTINTNLYDANGAGGNSIAMKLVTEGMKLQPCSPGFIDGRDAILQADEILYGGIHKCAIWEAFRRRGMGAFASQGSSGSVTDQIADFTVGSATLQLTQNVTQVPEGSNITYTNTVRTDNCGGITNFLLTDTLPSNVTYVSGGSYNSANRVVSFPVTLTAGQTQTYSFTVSVNTGAYFPTVTLFQDSANGPTIPSTWTASTTSAGLWSVSNARSFSPTTAYFSNNLDVQSEQLLTLGTPISLGSNPPPLTFRHWYNTESTYDGGVLESSVDGGTTWNDMQSNIQLGGYIATMDATTLLNGRRAWSGSSNGRFIKTKVNLLPYANQNLKIRFKFTSDVGTNLEGWYVDDIAIRNQAVVEMQSNLYTASNVRVGVSDTFTIILPPTTCVVASISAAPLSATVCAGSNVTFSTVALGTNPSYQWQVSTDGGVTFNNISGANATAYTVNNASVAQNNHQYRVIVSNACPSSATSSAAVLTVTNPASIVAQPANQSICAGGQINFNVTAVGSSIGYQWQVSTDGGATFTNIAGATNADLQLNGITASMNNNIYHVLVSSCTPAPLTSANATLTVNSTASITGQPSNTTVCPNADATFTAVVSGSGLSYQWQVSTDGGISFNDIVGANAATLTITGVTAAMQNNQYHVIINSSTCPGASTSSNAVLMVSNNAMITTQIISQVVCEGSSASFSVAASGSGLTYQWQLSTDGGLNFTNIAGANASTYTVNNVTPAMNGQVFLVVVSSACSAGGINSLGAELSVLSAANITQQPVNQTGCENSTVGFSANGTGNNASFQWQVSTDGGNTFTDLPGETNATLSLNITSSMNNNKYRLVVTSVGCNVATSNAATLSVSLPAAITTQPANVSGCTGSDVNIAVAATGTAISYQWQVSTNGGTTFTNIPGATASTLSLTGISETIINNNQYQVIITASTCGSITSNPSTVIVNALPIVTITASPTNIVYPGQSITLTASANPSSNTFSWYNNTALIAGITGSQISVDGSGLGNYSATVTDANGCIGISNIVQVKDTIVNYTFIYPNPNRGEFHVRFEGVPYNGFPRIITMYDAKGSRVFRQSYNVSTSYQVMDVNVKQFSKGSYVLVLSDVIGTTLGMGRVVIQ